MTKIGEGKEPAPKLSAQQYNEQLDRNSQKFLNALEGYQSGDSKEKAHLKGVMDQSLGLIKSAVNELKKTGIQKHEAKVEKDYKNYLLKDTPENFSALEEDISTLREYNQQG